MLSDGQMLCSSITVACSKDNADCSSVISLIEEQTEVVGYDIIHHHVNFRNLDTKCIILYMLLRVIHTQSHRAFSTGGTPEEELHV